MKTKSKSWQRGYSAIEFTLALPLLLFFVGIISEFGNIYIKYNTLSKAVQDGAQWTLKGRRGSNKFDIPDLDTGSDGSFVIGDPEQVKNLVVYGDIVGGSSGDELLKGLTVDHVTVEESGGYYIVSVAYTYSPFWSSFPYLTKNLDLELNATSVMRY